MTPKTVGKYKHNATNHSPRHKIQLTV